MTDAASYYIFTEMIKQRIKGLNTRKTICQQTLFAEHKGKVRYDESGVFSLPEVRLQFSGGVVDHGAEAVYVGTG